MKKGLVYASVHISTELYLPQLRISTYLFILFLFEPYPAVFRPALRDHSYQGIIDHKDLNPDTVVLSFLSQLGFLSEETTKFTRKVLN